MVGVLPQTKHSEDGIPLVYLTVAVAAVRRFVVLGKRKPGVVRTGGCPGEFFTRAVAVQVEKNAVGRACQIEAVARHVNDNWRVSEALVAAITCDVAATIIAPLHITRTRRATGARVGAKISAATYTYMTVCAGFSA